MAAACLVTAPLVTSSSRYSSNPSCSRKHKLELPLSVFRPTPLASNSPQNQKPEERKPANVLQSHPALSAFLGVGSALASASAFPEIASAAQLAVQEPQNALSLPTWVIHVSSVVEWITAMALVWQYGEKSGNDSWKGLSWGMVPLLGGAFCACTWHFFYNSESLEILVALQAALTVIGNLTLCIAAFRIYKSSQGGPENP